MRMNAFREGRRIAGPKRERTAKHRFDRKVAQMLAADYPFLDVMWTMFIFFAWVIWIWLLIMVLADNFRRTDHTGWAKAGWTLFVIFLPLFGVLIYMIVRSGSQEPMVT
jgi:hypothetical protein